MRLGWYGWYTKSIKHVLIDLPSIRPGNGHFPSFLAFLSTGEEKTKTMAWTR